eukprot:12923791-Prorocentrum_lima.AAC.1
MSLTHSHREGSRWALQASERVGEHAGDTPCRVVAETTQIQELKALPDSAALAEVELPEGKCTTL